MIYDAPEVVTHAILNDVLRSFLLEDSVPTVVRDGRTHRLRSFIDQKDGQIGWSLSVLCQMLGLGISGAHAGRLFKRQFGIGVRQYAAGRRLVKAAHLLRTTNLCVKTISANLGYRSTTDFCRKFKRAFQLTPTDYRRRGFVG